MIEESGVAEEIADHRPVRPHVVLLGAGASRAALPTGDRSGTPIPLLAEVAAQLDLRTHFPRDLQGLADSDFEAAYSQLFDRDRAAVEPIDSRVRIFFQELEIPDEATIYDALLLSLRPKDAIFTFNWDPFLLQANLRLMRAGVRDLPRLHFLHGCVAVGYCPDHNVMMTLSQRCRECASPPVATRLLFPVEHKDYQGDGFVKDEWDFLRGILRETLFFTIFGYSAPATDVEAIDLLKDGWGPVEERQFEQTEIINRAGADEDELRATWDPFIHTHHYEIHGSFFDSWLANHPRRSIEAFHRQYIEAQFIENNPIPTGLGSLTDLISWFQPLLDAEASADSDDSAKEP